MHGRMTCDFTSFSTMQLSERYSMIQLFPIRMIMKGCVQWNPVGILTSMSRKKSSCFAELSMDAWMDDLRFYVLFNNAVK